MNDALVGLWAMARRTPTEAQLKVLADALIEADDPRGRFMLLQLTEGQQAHQQAQHLLSRHRAEWLGPFVELMSRGGEIWRGGLLRGLRARTSGTWPELEEPDWRTIESVDLGRVKRHPLGPPCAPQPWTPHG